MKILNEVTQKNAKKNGICPPQISIINEFTFGKRYCYGSKEKRWILCCIYTKRKIIVVQLIIVTSTSVSIYCLFSLPPSRSLKCFFFLKFISIVAVAVAIRPNFVHSNCEVVMAMPFPLLWYRINFPRLRERMDDVGCVISFNLDSTFVVSLWTYSWYNVYLWCVPAK